MADSEREPLINPNPTLQAYYGSLESRIGYRVFLSGTRHFGYYESDTWWPFPIGKALRAMEDHLFRSLGLKSGAQVLDAGCGVGHVAIHLARKGLRVQGIDIVDHHLDKARRNVRAAGLGSAITVRKGDYHHLDPFADSSLDGIYTMETFVHATDPKAALGEFFRVLKPGGSMALYEYDHPTLKNAPEHMVYYFNKVKEYAAMPSNTLFEDDTLQCMLEETGFSDVKVTDISLHIWPLLRLFFICAYLPYLLIKLFGLEAWFVNTMAAVEVYRGRRLWRYVVVTAKKPSLDGAGEVRKRL